MKTLSKKFAFVAGLAVCTLSATTSFAGSQYHRVMWDKDPAHNALIGFSPVGTTTSASIKYGFTTDQSTWQTKTPSSTRTFGGSLKSHFVRLTNLPANSPVYYKTCDSTGCDSPLWFKTAPTDNSPYVVVAGGDTRTGHTTRRNGNKLIAKVRPLFIMHGGDFTNANSVSEMKSYLSDWSYTFSNDIIDATSYKRIYPFIPTHGNHEDGNYSTLCEVFGVDYNSDNQCNAKDTYGAFNVSPLLRAYTLNSQFKNSGWSSYATAQNNWLSSDLSQQGSSAVWRVAQYHKPMFPHYSGKSENQVLFDWWGSHFYNNKMNLVVESDTHINKLTKAIKPSGSSFVETNDGGTVYVGEGSWGAPARSANDPKSWTIDLASIQQFKIIQVKPDEMIVKTAQFDSSASTLSLSQRQADPLVLPNSINWWVASTVGDTLTLKQNAAKRTVIDYGTTPPDPVEPGVLTNKVAATGLTSTTAKDLFFTLDVPANQQNLTFGISGGTGDADLYVKFGSKPTSSSYDCRPYKNGNTENCPITIAKAGTYFVMLKAYANFSGVSLLASFDEINTPTNQAPTAAFTSANNNLSVSFSDQSSDSDGTVSARSWNFGDQSTSTQLNPTHVYSSAGTYTVSLTVTDNDGATNTTSKSITVTNTPTNQAPTAAFTSSKTDLSVAFTSQSSDSDGSITAYNWEFGDQSSSSLTNPTHVYASAGSYQVKLTVTDNNGASNSMTKTVTVSDASTGTCTGVDAWQANKAYSGGTQVSYLGKIYKAAWWTQGANPAENSGPYQQWFFVSNC